MSSPSTTNKNNIRILNIILAVMLGVLLVITPTFWAKVMITAYFVRQAVMRLIE